jgi:hypothetical protein
VSLQQPAVQEKSDNQRIGPSDGAFFDYDFSIRRSVQAVILEHSNEIMAGDASADNVIEGASANTGNCVGSPAVGVMRHALSPSHRLSSAAAAPSAVLRNPDRCAGPGIASGGVAAR